MIKRFGVGIEIGGDNADTKIEGNFIGTGDTSEAVQVKKKKGKGKKGKLCRRVTA